jgi:hypothetical protein
VACLAIAVSRIIGVAVVEVVIVREFFSDRDVANGADEHTAIDLVSFTVWTTGMVYESGNIVAVNYVFPIGQAEQIGARGTVVDGVGLVVRQAWPRVLDNNVLPADCCGGVDTIAMNLGSSDNESHRESYRAPCQQGVLGALEDADKDCGLLQFAF